MSAGAIARLGELLAACRQRLAVLLAQRARLGAYALPIVQREIESVRAQIRVIKDDLRAAGIEVEDAPDDHASSELYADPRRTVVIAGDTIISSNNIYNTGGTISDATPHLNTRFDGIGPDAPLRVGQRVPLIISVGARGANDAAQSSRPFAFAFPNAETPVVFTVQVRGDPVFWTIKAVESTLIVAPPGTTTQEAEFLVTAREPGRDKLYITVAQASSGAVVQDVWLTVDAALPTARTTQVVARQSPPAADTSELSGLVAQLAFMSSAPLPASPSPAAFSALHGATVPLDAQAVGPRAVRLTIQQAGSDTTSFLIFVDAHFAHEHVYLSYRVPLSAAEIQNATQRLRHELEQIGLYDAGEGAMPRHPFADGATLTVDDALARRAAVALADAGQQVWSMIFDGPRAPDDLRRFARRLRDLPDGAAIQIVLDNPQFILPWALLYDAPGLISADTLDWSGFWGYRYRLDVLVPGAYPDPLLTDDPLRMQMVLNDDVELQRFAAQHAQFAQEAVRAAHTRVAWGHAGFTRSLQEARRATLWYCFCHGTHTSGAVQARALVGESALIFSAQRAWRLADLRRMQDISLPGRPLVFLNACEGATQDAFFYDGLMPFFIEQQGARGFIGTEVKAPTLLASDFALTFLRAFAAGEAVGDILWRLRRHYLDTHNTILAFNYTLYGLGDMRMATALTLSAPPSSVS